MKEIDLTQENLNKLEVGEKFIYTIGNHYKQGLVVCVIENNNIMIPLSTICSIEKGVENARMVLRV